jgi:hypothetical protein
MRMCRREPRELLLEATKQVDKQAPGNGLAAGATVNLGVVTEDDTTGTGRAIIGGGCCVSLSVEYMPSTLSLSSTQTAVVIVVVEDSAGTILAWERQFKEGYHVQECIITTNPGAILGVGVKNAIARVRWCEVFSC